MPEDLSILWGWNILPQRLPCGMAVIWRMQEPQDCFTIAPNAFPMRNVFPSAKKVTEVERKNPFLLHAKVGAYLAREKYGIKDPDILNAIQNHTTGRKNMSLLEKIIFVADYIEPGRKHAPNLAEVRKLAFMDIDRALLMILRDTLQYLKASGGDIDPMTEETWRYYSQQ